MRAFAIFATLLLTGCAAANYGTTNAQYTGSTAGAALAQAIVPGKTTKAEVTRLLGQPSHTMVSAGQEVWMYENRNMPMLAGMIVGATGAYKASSTMIYFDANGVVSSFNHV